MKRTDPNLAYWRGVLKAAEQELDAATGNITLKAAATRYMRAKAEVERLEQAKVFKAFTSRFGSAHH